jgi:transcription initiation factor TFIID subunit 2
MDREAKLAVPDDYTGERPFVGLHSAARFSHSNLWPNLRSFVFREPVDPIALGIPQYHEIIPRKDARDLRMIRQKLDADKYETPEGWEADIDLMIRNAIHFNGEESEVGQIAVAFGNRIKELRVQQGLKKRRDSERPGGDQQQQQPAAKKARLS